MKPTTPLALAEIEGRWKNHSPNDIEVFGELPPSSQIVSDIYTLLSYIEEHCWTDDREQDIWESGYEEGYDAGWQAGLESDQNE